MWEGGEGPLEPLAAVHDGTVCRDRNSTPAQPWLPLGLWGVQMGMETLQVSVVPPSIGPSPRIFLETQASH